MTSVQRSAKRALVVVWLVAALMLGIGLWRIGGRDWSHRRPSDCPASGCTPPSTLPMPT